MVGNQEDELITENKTIISQRKQSNTRVLNNLLKENHRKLNFLIGPDETGRSVKIPT